MAMDPRHLTRLQEEQIKAISETDVKIEQLEHFKQDYKSVQERLRTLPDKLTHDVMVPFGKLAFMPGRLTHTNEILALLGDNWFVERSAKQAADIVDRRIKELDKKLTDLRAQQKLLQPRLGFTSELQAEIQGHGEVKEIIEEYDETKEKLWDEQHRKNVKKYKEELRRKTESQNSLLGDKDVQNSQEKQDSQKTDEYLWSRLDELERQEVQRGELRSLSDREDNGSEKEGDCKESAPTDNPSHTERRVNWADELKEEDDSKQDSDESSGEYTDDDDDDDDADSEADDGDDDEEAGMPRNPVRKTITFTHSSSPFVLPHQVSEGGDLAIHCPADIYKLYCPKSILKKTLDNDGLSDGNPTTESSLSKLQNVGRSKRTSHVDRGYTATSDVDHQPQKDSFASSQSSASGASKAFTGFVVEKTSSLPPSATITTDSSSSCAATAAGTSARLPPPKRMSKFKASRHHETTS